ncbi:MAG: TetR/AcrR family transcriptional regulator [Sporichthyaceae bacterium]|jgi:AcrR family transcriptional regulator
MTTAASAPTRRELRYRQTAEEIKDLAREQLRTTGAAALSLRAVARDLGVASSAVYRYFPSRDHLITALCVDAYDSVGTAMQEAIAGTGRAGPARQWWAMMHAMRAWALSHPVEFGLIVGPPVPGHHVEVTDTGPASSRFMTPPFAVYLAAVRKGAADPGAVAAPAEAGVGPTLRYFLDQVDPAYPPDLAAAVVGQMFGAIGLVALEIFGAVPQLFTERDRFWASQVRSGMVVLGFAPATVRRLS